MFASLYTFQCLTGVYFLVTIVLLYLYDAVRYYTKLPYRNRFGDGGIIYVFPKASIFDYEVINHNLKKAKALVWFPAGRPRVPDPHSDTHPSPSLIL